MTHPHDNPCIEFHPENGGNPWIVVYRIENREIWFAYADEDSARIKMADQFFMSLCERLRSSPKKLIA